MPISPDDARPMGGADGGYGLGVGFGSSMPARNPRSPSPSPRRLSERSEVERLRAEVAYLRADVERRKLARDEERQQLLRKLALEASRQWEQTLALGLLLVACVLLVATSVTNLELGGAPCPPAVQVLAPPVEATAPDLIGGRPPRPKVPVDDTLEYLGELDLSETSPHDHRLGRLQREAQHRSGDGGVRARNYADRLLDEGLSGDPYAYDELQHDSEPEDIDATSKPAEAEAVQCGGDGCMAAEEEEKAAQQQAEQASLDEEDAEAAAVSSAATVAACASSPCRNSGKCGASPPPTSKGSLDTWRFVEGRKGCPPGTEPARPVDIGDDVSAAAGLLCEWCIAALGDGHRLSGRGYGGKVEKETGDPPGDYLCKPKEAPADVSEGGSSYACDCTDGWSGTHCETDVDECAVSEPCKDAPAAVCYDSSSKTVPALFGKVPIGANFY